MTTLVNDEYKILRETRIALLCVGEKIKRVSRILGSYNFKTGGHDLHYVISEEIISEIIGNDTISLTLGIGFRSRFPTSSIELYKGLLYVYSAVDMTEKLDQEVRLREIARIVDDKDTCHEYRL